MVLARMPRRFVVLGGAGAIGRVIVRDLFESNRRNQIVVADFDREAAEQTAAEYNSSRVTHAFTDARYLSRITSVMRDQSVAINCTHHQFNLTVMEAALRSGVHYVDLGGLFVWTRRQLRYHRPFQEAGLTAILG